MMIGGVSPRRDDAPAVDGRVQRHPASAMPEKDRSQGDPSDPASRTSARCPRCSALNLPSATTGLGASIASKRGPRVTLLLLLLLLPD